MGLENSKHPENNEKEEKLSSFNEGQSLKKEQEKIDLLVEYINANSDTISQEDVEKLYTSTLENDEELMNAIQIHDLNDFTIWMTKKGITIAENIETEKLNSIQKTQAKTMGITTKQYFAIDNKFSSIGLSIEDTVSKHINYIENEIKPKSTSNMSSQEFIQLKKNIYKIFAQNLKVTANELQQQNKNKTERWIANENIGEKINYIDETVLPLAKLLIKYSRKDFIKSLEGPSKFAFERRNGELLKTHIATIKEALLNKNFSINENGKIDEGIDLKNILTAFRPQIFQSATEKQEQIANRNKTLNYTKYGLDSTTLLNEEDQKTEEEAMMYYLGAIALQITPYVGAAASVPIDLTDMVSSQDATLSYLKKAGLIPDEYKFKKEYYDYVFAGLGVVGAVFGAQALAKSPKTLKILNKIRKISGNFDITKFKQAIKILGTKLGMDENSVAKAIDIVKGNKPVNVDRILHPLNHYLESNLPLKNPKLKKGNEMFYLRFAHGSSSGSLKGFLDHSGLFPFNKLQENHIPVFSGEWSIKSLDTVRSKVSIVDRRISNNEINYSKAFFNSKKFSPEELEKEIKSFKSKNRREDAEIREQQLRQFKQLDQIEKDFITEPFSVVYGIHHTSDLQKKSMSVPLISSEVQTKELKLGENIPAIFVPNNKIKIVQKYIQKKGKNIEVLSLEKYKKHAENVDYTNADYSNYSATHIIKRKKSDTKYKMQMQKIEEARKQKIEAIRIADQEFGHGSNSASLVGVTRDGGLIPTGTLIERGNAPFSGELAIGISDKGVNSHSISLANRRSGLPTLDIEYSTGKGMYEKFNSIGWNPKKGKIRLKKLEDELTKTEQAAPTIMKRRNMNHKQYNTFFVSQIKNQIIIEKSRLENYKKLSRMEKSFINNPFPVIYRIGNEIDLQDIANKKAGMKGKMLWALNNKGETTYKGKLSLKENIKCILVPRDKIEFVRKYFKNKGLDYPNIFAIEDVIPPKKTPSNAPKDLRVIL